MVLFSSHRDEYFGNKQFIWVGCPRDRQMLPCLPMLNHGTYNSQHLVDFLKTSHQKQNFPLLNFHLKPQSGSHFEELCTRIKEPSAFLSVLEV